MSTPFRRPAACLLAGLVSATSMTASAKGPPVAFVGSAAVAGSNVWLTGPGSERVPQEPSATDPGARAAPAPYDWFAVLTAGDVLPDAPATAPVATPTTALKVWVAGPGSEQAPEEPSAGVPRTDPEAWFTGPIAAASASTLPRGHVLFEPYLYDVRGPSGDFIGSTVYLLYGLTDRLTVGVIPTFGSARTEGSVRPRRFGVGDTALTAQLRLHKAATGDLVPTTSIIVQRFLPLGRFDRLGSDPDRGIGGGAPGTLIGLYTQRVDLVGSGRPLRTRVDLTYTFSGSAAVEGVSVYGTPSDFVGRVRPGDVAVADVAFEYSLSRRWALAVDLIYRRTGAGRLKSGAAIPSATTTRLPSDDSFSVAPAVEYSWSARRGVLLGLRWTARNGARAGSFTPVVAFNAVF